MTRVGQVYAYNPYQRMALPQQSQRQPQVVFSGNQENEQSGGLTLGKVLLGIVGIGLLVAFRGKIKTSALKWFDKVKKAVAKSFGDIVKKNVPKTKNVTKNVTKIVKSPKKYKTTAAEYASKEVAARPKYASTAFRSSGKVKGGGSAHSRKYKTKAADYS